MIHIAEKQNCCGCAACVQRCPKKCINLVEDSEGFLYPEVDVENCIECGLCEQVCFFYNRNDSVIPLMVLAVKNRNVEERLNSSSGGVFVALSKYIIKEKGVVFGAVFDNHWEVKHTHTDKLSGVHAMMRSKYLQSRIENSYIDAEHFLKEGRKVLFSGTPCQIAGLHSFLRKDYPNLLTVDFLCHGVPSPGVWRRYLDETFFRTANKMNVGDNAVSCLSKNDISTIAKITFRDKKYYGWNMYCFVVYGVPFSMGEEREVILLSDKYHENPYMRGFLSDIYLRPSCYQCKCKNGLSHSDITIADFWGIDKLMPDFDDNKGVGLVLLNTRLGKDVFGCLDMEVRKSTLKDAKRFNNGFKENLKPHSRRDEFFRSFSEGKDVTYTVNRLLYVPIYKRIFFKLKNLLVKYGIN